MISLWISLEFRSLISILPNASRMFSIKKSNRRNLRYFLLASPRRKSRTVFAFPSSRVFMPLDCMRLYPRSSLLPSDHRYTFRSVTSLALIKSRVCLLCVYVCFCVTVCYVRCPSLILSSSKSAECSFQPRCMCNMHVDQRGKFKVRVACGPYKQITQFTFMYTDFKSKTLVILFSTYNIYH